MQVSVMRQIEWADRLQHTALVLIVPESLAVIGMLGVACFRDLRTFPLSAAHGALVIACLAVVLQTGMCIVERLIMRKIRRWLEHESGRRGLVPPGALRDMNRDELTAMVTAMLKRQLEEDDLGRLAKRIDAHPSFAVDTATRIRRLVRGDRNRLRALLTRHLDRILYATDFSLRGGDLAAAARTLMATHDRDRAMFSGGARGGPRGPSDPGAGPPPGALPRCASANVTTGRVYALTRPSRRRSPRRSQSHQRQNDTHFRRTVTARVQGSASAREGS